MLLGVYSCLAQLEGQPANDSLFVKGRLGLMGRWQTGNLNQISIMPNGNISFDKTDYYCELNATYQFIKVDGFKVKDDLWTYSLYQHQPNRLIFLSGHAIMGYARSYSIAYSTVVGIGGGINVLKKNTDNIFTTSFVWCLFQL